jgi:hypothetical protein
METLMTEKINGKFNSTGAMAATTSRDDVILKPSRFVVAVVVGEYCSRSVEAEGLCFIAGQST